VNAPVCFAQTLKIFARKIANFLALGMRPHPLHPHAICLCPQYYKIINNRDYSRRARSYNKEYQTRPLLLNLWLSYHKNDYPSIIILLI